MSRVAVIGFQFPVPPTQVKNRIDPARQMIAWDHVIKAEAMEKTLLATLQPPHHRSVLLNIFGKMESRSPHSIKSEFCNRIDPNADVP